MNARDLFDQGATVSEAAAETGTQYTIAAHLCRPLDPNWPTFSPKALAAMPEHTRQMIEANNPNHKKATP